MTKSVYVRFCNQIHLLNLQAKGGKDRKEVRKAKQDIMAELVVVAKQQIELMTNHSNEKGSRLGDGKPLSGSSQSLRHELGGYPDR